MRVHCPSLQIAVQLKPHLKQLLLGPGLRRFQVDKTAFIERISGSFDRKLKQLGLNLGRRAEETEQ